MSLTRIFLAGTCLVISLHAGTVVTTSPCISPADGSGIYDIATQLFQGGQEGIPNPLQITPSNCVNLPDSSIGSQTNASFEGTVSGVYLFNNGASGLPITGAATVGVTATYEGTSDETDTYDLQLTILDLSLPNGAEIRVDPTMPSTGVATITNDLDGTFQINSFFDIFTDLSLDGGNTWISSTGGGPGGSSVASLDPATPEPSTLVLVSGAFLLIGAAKFRRRR